MWDPGEQPPVRVGLGSPNSLSLWNSDTGWWHNYKMDTMGGTEEGQVWGMRGVISKNTLGKGSQNTTLL